MSLDNERLGYIHVYLMTQSTILSFPSKKLLLSLSNLLSLSSLQVHRQAIALPLSAMTIPDRVHFRRGSQFRIVSSNCTQKVSMEMNPSSRPKRNYIRRKKCFNDSASLVKSTLRFISSTLGTPSPIEAIDRAARGHAAAIEAVCWDPRTTKLTDDLYQTLMVSKTRELCVALIFRHLPEQRAAQVVAGLRDMDLLRGVPGQRRDAIPGAAAVEQRDEMAPGDFARAEDAGMESFPEIPRLRFEGADILFDADETVQRWGAE
jgi:hypothetical protein